MKYSQLWESHTFYFSVSQHWEYIGLYQLILDIKSLLDAPATMTMSQESILITNWIFQ